MKVTAPPPEAPPPLPEPLPAPLNFVVHNGVAELLDNPSTKASPPPFDELWSSVYQGLERLQESGVSNAPRIAGSVARALEALGPSSAKFNAIGSGMAGLELKALAEIAHNVLPDDLAALLIATGD